MYVYLHTHTYVDRENVSNGDPMGWARLDTKLDLRVEGLKFVLRVRWVLRVRVYRI